MYLFFGLIFLYFYKGEKMIYNNWPHTIYNIDGKLLVEAQQKITKTLITKISKQTPYETRTVILAQTDIHKDIKTALDEGIYKVIFSPSYIKKQVLDIVARTEFSLKIVKELERIRAFFPSTYRHLLVVAALSIRISLDLMEEGYDPEKVSEIGFVHDLGKSRIPINILQKKTALTNDEFKLIQKHPLIDYILLSHYLNNPKSLIAHAAFAHHERLDGSGYPMGTRRLNRYVQTIIPCDVFDALVSNRPYRNEPFTIRAALDLLLEESKKGKLNAKYVLCLISYIRKDRPHYSQVRISEINRDAPPSINYYGIRAK